MVTTDDSLEEAPEAVDERHELQRESDPLERPQSLADLGEDLAKRRRVRLRLDHLVVVRMFDVDVEVEQVGHRLDDVPEC